MRCFVGCDSGGPHLQLSLKRVGDEVGGVRTLTRTLGQKQAHAEFFFQLLAGLLDEAETNLQDLSAFGILSGPGSFTGLRVGFSVLKTLAHTQQKPLYCYDAFGLMLRLVRRQKPLSSPAAITIPSGGNAVYWALFDPKTQAISGPYHYGSVDSLAAFLSKASTNHPIHLVMRGLEEEVAALSSSSGVGEVKKIVVDWLARGNAAEVALPCAEEVASWVAEDFVDDDRTHLRSAMKAKPLYIKPAVML